MRLPGIDLGTVRLVAQRLNHYATPGPIEYLTGRVPQPVWSLWKTEKILFHAGD